MNKQTLLTSDWSQFRNSAREQTSDWWNRTWRASCCAAIGSSCCCSASFGLWEPQSLDRWMRAPPPEGTMSLHYTDTTMTSLTVWMNVWCGGCRWDQVTMSDTEVRWGEARWGEVRWGEEFNEVFTLQRSSDDIIGCTTWWQTDSRRHINICDITAPLTRSELHQTVFSLLQKHFLSTCSDRKWSFISCKSDNCVCSLLRNTQSLLELKSF